MSISRTSLIGREQEVAEVCTLLSQAEVRLLTLTGPGGVGKTRLALHIASEVQHDFADRVCFVSLAPLHDAMLVVPTISHTLGRCFHILLSPLCICDRLCLPERGIGLSLRLTGYGKNAPIT